MATGFAIDGMVTPCPLSAILASRERVILRHRFDHVARAQRKSAVHQNGRSLSFGTAVSSSQQRAQLRIAVLLHHEAEFVLAR